MNKPLTVLRYRAKRRVKDYIVPATMGNIKITCGDFFQPTNLYKHLALPAMIFSQIQIHQLKIGKWVKITLIVSQCFMLVCSVLLVCEFGGQCRSISPDPVYSCPKASH